MNLLIFGAGASFGSDASGTPPLGDALFEALQQFDPSGWGQLPESIAEEFVGDFEAGIAALFDRGSHALPPLQRAMAAYFFEFAPRRSNLYVEIARRVHASQWDGAIATLNYERLVELSLIHAGVQPVIGTATRPGRTVELCIPHGCCHIFCDSVRGAAGRVSFGPSVTTAGDVRLVGDPAEFGRRIRTDAFPPVMSYFEPQKRTATGTNFIDNQRTRWAELVRNADRIAVVGMRVREHDEHLWRPLEEAAGQILYCSGSSASEEFTDWAQRKRFAANDSISAGYFRDDFDAICGHLALTPE